MHEIANPVEAIGYLAYLTLHEAEHPAKVREYMIQTQQQVATLSRIAGETLGFGQQTKKPRPVDLVALAEAAIQIHQPANRIASALPQLDGFEVPRSDGDC